MKYVIAPHKGYWAVWEDVDNWKKCNPISDLYVDYMGAFQWLLTK